MMKISVATLVFGCLTAMDVNATMDFNQWYSSSVKTGQPWAQIETQVDSVQLNVEINRGVVVTKAAITYTPSIGVIATYNPAYTQATYKSQVMDSIESSTSFNLGYDASITDMELWVGNVKVKAELQQRDLASAQYESIVKRRKDPAILETWGNGYYQLKIFPNKSLVSRKIEITFVQAMGNDENNFSVNLPFIQSLATKYSSDIQDASLWPKRKTNYLSLNAIAKDGKSYNLIWDGLGKGSITNFGLKLIAKDIEELKLGTISAAGVGCADCLDPWISEIPGQSYFGVNTKLKFSDLKVEAEPMERNIILDADNVDSFSGQRARKLALLALKAYGVSPNKINLGFSNGFGGINFVFATPISLNPDNLNKAYLALKNWNPIQKANATLVLEAFAKLKGMNNPKSAVILINNEISPDFKLSNPGYTPVYNVNTFIDLKVQAFEDKQNALMKKLAATLNQANINLFGFWNNYRLASAASETNGYQLGGLEGWIYPPYPSYAYEQQAVANPTAIKTIAAPPVITDWQFPALYGKGRSDFYGIQKLALTTSGVAIDNAVLLQENIFNYFGSRCMACVIEDDVPAYGRYYFNPESTLVNISGNYHIGGTAILSLTGYLGGLKFSKEYTVSLPSSAGAGSAGASIWANEYSEFLGNDYLTDNTNAIQQLGFSYHFVNRQMSLLALEPGMQLWTALPNSPNQNGKSITTSSAAPIQDQAKFAGPTGTNIDSLSLEAILLGNVSGIKVITQSKLNQNQFSISKNSGGIHFNWNLPSDESQAQFKILDLSGKIVAEMAGKKNGNSFGADWNGKIKSGTYFVTANSGTLVLTQSIILRP